MVKPVLKYLLVYGGNSNRALRAWFMDQSKFVSCWFKGYVYMLLCFRPVGIFLEDTLSHPVYQQC